MSDTFTQSFQPATIDCCKRDSLNRMQGFWEHPSAFNIFSDDRIVKGMEVWECGNYKHSIKSGVWVVYVSKNQPLGYRIYHENGDYSEIQLKRGRAKVIISFEKLGINSDSTGASFKAKEIWIFDRRGKVERRLEF